MLRGYVKACGDDDPLNIKTRGLLWLHVPDFKKKGILRTIKEIQNPLVSLKPLSKIEKKEIRNTVFWKEETDCAGFNVSKNCRFRDSEMRLITYTPQECL